jgi:hypothetical protein
LYQAAECVYRASHVQIDCKTVAGAGFDLKWTVRVAKQDSEVLDPD